MKNKNCSALGNRSYPQSLLSRTLYWNPPVPSWKPLKNLANSSLRMACIVGERLYQGLRYEGEVELLTPNNWRNVLQYGKVDFLLMESIWSTTTGHWYMGQCPYSQYRDELLQIVNFAQSQSIPTVFWITKGYDYHNIYKDFAKNFDYVFCADLKESEMLGCEGIKSEVLQPCVQPALYNPFRYYKHCSTFSLDIIYDGWADLDRLGSELDFLQELKDYDLNIIESRYQVFYNRLNALPNYKDNILGCVTESSRISALRYAKSYVSLEKSVSTKTAKQWKDLEASACRLPVVHYGLLSKDDPRKNIAVECSSYADFLAEFVRFREDEIYREHVAHIAWRRTLQKHTFAHRLKELCSVIGLDNDWKEFPKVSLITPTFRKELLSECLQTYERQTYPNKELVIVFNGSNFPESSLSGIEKSRYDVKLASVPAELFAGACMNYGHTLAEGSYCFRVDDDDFYGNNYVLDMMLYSRCLDVELFGKPPVPVSFEGESEAYDRGKVPQLCVVSQGELSEGGVWFGGNSIGGKKKLFLECKYDELAYGAADTSFILGLDGYRNVKNNYAIVDNFNLVAIRNKDKHNHTWNISQESLGLSCVQIASVNDFFI